MARKNPHKSILSVELPVTGYTDAQALQQKLVAARQRKIIDTDVVLWLEHFSVFTFGRNGGLNNLLLEPEVLEKRGISTVKSERGGNITFHAPGQLIVYPIIDLENARLDIPQYVSLLEEVMIRTAKDVDVEIHRQPGKPGVWAGNRKVGSIGVAVSKGVSYHGMALNVNLDLTPFQWIHPCGFTNITMSSLEKERSEDVESDKVKRIAQSHMASIFKKELVMIGKQEICSLINC